MHIYVSTATQIRIQQTRSIGCRFCFPTVKRGETAKSGVTADPIQKYIILFTSFEEENGIRWAWINLLLVSTSQPMSCSATWIIGILNLSAFAVRIFTHTQAQVTSDDRGTFGYSHKVVFVSFSTKSCIVARWM